MTRPRPFLDLATLAAVLLAVMPAARAEVFPSRPVTLVAPALPGAVTDTQARILAERMRTSLGQPVVVENVGGGGSLWVSTALCAPHPTATPSASASGAATSPRQRFFRSDTTS